MTCKKILIIDDNAINLKLVKLILNLDGHMVITATDAQLAFKILETFEPDMILVDIQLPDMDGLEFTREIKKTPKGNKMLIVALSAYAMVGDEKKAIDAGCAGYITKPIDPDQFSIQVAHFLLN